MSSDLDSGPTLYPGSGTSEILIVQVDHRCKNVCTLLAYTYVQLIHPSLLSELAKSQDMCFLLV
jgi:hypothetical protein